MFVSPQNSGVETLPRNVVDQEVQLLRSHRIRWGLHGVPLTNGISVLLETRETFPSLPLSLFLSLPVSHMRTQPKGHHPPSRRKIFIRTPPRWHPDLELPTFRRGRNKLLCFFITTSSMALCYSALNRLRKDKSKDIHEAWPWSGREGAAKRGCSLLRHPSLWGWLAN